MKILLIAGQHWNSWEALGLGYIARAVQHHFPEVEIEFYHGSFDHRERILNAAAGVDLIGYSATSQSYGWSKQLAQAIEERHPLSSRRHVLGGYHASAVPEEVIEDGVFGQVVAGYGEKAFCDIIRGVTQPILYGGLDETAFQMCEYLDRHFIQSGRHIRETEINDGKRIMSIHGQRGCPHNCTFCADGNNCMSQGASMLYRDQRDVLGELNELEKVWEVEHVKFTDPTWNSNRDWALLFCALKQQHSNMLEWSANIHAGSSSAELFKLMRASNCVQVSIGVESGSDEILKRNRKGVRVEQVSRALIWAREAGLRVRIHICLGLPGETQATCEETYRFLLLHEADFDEIGIFMFAPYPGSQIFERHKEEILPLIESAGGYASLEAVNNRVWRTEALTNEEIRKQVSRFQLEFVRKLSWHNQHYLSR